MSKLDLHAALRNVIAAQVEAALEPHRDLLNSLAELAREQQQVASQPASRAARRPAERRGKRGGRNLAAAPSANSFSAGQLVSYRQGRGTFQAKIMGIDAESAELTLERVSDVKRIARPFDKVIVAG
jgi:hypothetical protein